MIRTCHAYNSNRKVTPNSVIKGQRVDELFGIISDVTEIRINDASLHSNVEVIWGCMVK